MPPNPPSMPGALARECPRCREPMHIFSASGHQGKALHLDLCPHCRAVWFDAKEALQLPGLGWVALLRQLVGTAAPVVVALDEAALLCPSCKLPLQTRYNQTRTGRFSLQQCECCAGHLQTQVGLLAQWGYFRQALAADWGVLAREQRVLLCQGCGGDLAHGAKTCAYCHTPAFVVDMKRLGHALQLPDIQGTLQTLSAPATGARLETWPCHACGHPLDPLRDAVCGRCQHSVLVTRLQDIMPALDGAEQLLRNPPSRAKAQPDAGKAWKPTAAQQRIDRMTSGFSAQGDRKAFYVGVAYTFFLLVLLGLVKCMNLL